MQVNQPLIQFSGFYEVKAKLDTVRQLPIGSAAGIPCIGYNIPNADNTSWLYCLPQQDAALSGELIKGKVAFSFFPDESILDEFTPTHLKQQPQPINEQAVLHSRTAILENWVGHRFDEILFKEI